MIDRKLFSAPQLVVGLAAAAAVLLAGPAGATAKRTQLGTQLEVSLDTVCESGVTCTLKFGLENSDYLITDLSCHLLFDLNGAQPLSYKLSSFPGTAEYLYNPGGTASGATGKADVVLHQPMMHILPKGSNPLVTVTFDSPPSNAALGCTWAGTSRP